MKVVIFCGGLGVRMGEETQRIPKPMIEIGGKPILWHIMRYYSSFGYRDFVLCLGYKPEVIKDYYHGRRDTITGLVLLPAAVKAATDAGAAAR